MRRFTGLGIVLVLVFLSCTKAESKNNPCEFDVNLCPVMQQWVEFQTENRDELFSTDVFRMENRFVLVLNSGLFLAILCYFSAWDDYLLLVETDESN